MDNEDHFCVLDVRTFRIYDDFGNVLRELSLRDQKGDFPGGWDFCLDDEGNIYTYRNLSGEVFVNKFNSEGLLQGKMTNDYQLAVSQDGRDRFLGKNIFYIHHYGLIICDDAKGHIPVNFTAGKVPDMSLRQKLIQNFVIGANSTVKLTFQRVGDFTMEINQPAQAPKEVQITYNGTLECTHIFSRDENNQYLYLAKAVAGSKRYEEEIRKYHGDELLFTTGPLPPNKIEWAVGKTRVVDSQGTIYYYCGDENGIQILRWSLK